ncbi:HAD family hydrolase [Zwartia sp.]|uniref:HAD family hydrolase n=1 Tax=Zwartia sp. TaxID=2978004 RepID=UPI0027216928|nr:HAD family hydrolase [Zwartia sp.]MDO9026204.1 HAD family hydrolase [Zwartia sp.]
MRKFVVSLLFFVTYSVFAQTLLPSWNDGPSKQAVLSFIEKTTAKDSPDFVPVSQRIAVFDNDGTLWSEQPIYVQISFTFDRIKALAHKHPEWTTQQPFKAVLENDIKGVMATGQDGLFKLIAATHAGVTTEEFREIAEQWIKTARHPKTGRLYTEMVYQPMLELLAHLESRGYKNYIVSGGGIEFMRPWTELVYGIPPERVIGSSIKSQFQIIDGSPRIVGLPEMQFIDDKENKPIAIQERIGRRPIMAFGNSDGDYEMLLWTTAGKGPRFGMLIHHTDDVREVAYDRQSSIGRLNTALDEAPIRGWTVVDMKREWREIFPAK